MVKEFKEFIMRGNVVDLAVAVVIGAAFTLVVNSFVNDVLLQLIAVVAGEPSFSGMSFELNGSVIRYGSFITALVNFLIVALAVFMVVKAINKVSTMRKTPAEEAAVEETELALLMQIRDALVSSGTPGTPGTGTSGPKTS